MFDSVPFDIESVSRTIVVVNRIGIVSRAIRTIVVVNRIGISCHSKLSLLSISCCQSNWYLVPFDTIVVVNQLLSIELVSRAIRYYRCCRLNWHLVPFNTHMASRAIRHTICSAVVLRTICHLPYDTIVVIELASPAIWHTHSIYCHSTRDAVVLCTIRHTHGISCHSTHDAVVLCIIWHGITCHSTHDMQWYYRCQFATLIGCLFNWYFCWNGTFDMVSTAHNT